MITRCKDCECCYKTNRSRWDSTKQETILQEVYYCFGVSEPFEIDPQLYNSYYPDCPLMLEKSVKNS